VAEIWYVPTVPQWEASGTQIVDGVEVERGSHIFRACLPDEVYDFAEAWLDDMEIGFGRRRIVFRDGMLTDAMRSDMVKCGCSPLKDGKPSRPTTMTDRREALKAVGISARITRE